MNKTILATAIMEKTDQYKKTHLKDMHKSDLEAIYAELYPAEPSTTISEPVPVSPVAAPEVQTTATEGTHEANAEPIEKEIKVTDNEKLLLATIPQLLDFSGTDATMNGRAFVKKAEELYGIPLNKARSAFSALKTKGYYTTQGKESGQTRTTFQLSDLGIKYLQETGLLA